MRALLLERAGRCLRPPFKGPTFQGPGLSHPVPRRRNPDRWTCARSAACPGMQGLPATTGNSMLLCVVGLFWRLAPALGRLRARAHPLTRLSRRSQSLGWTRSAVSILLEQLGICSATSNRRSCASPAPRATPHWCVDPRPLPQQAGPQGDSLLACGTRQRRRPSRRERARRREAHWTVVAPLSPV